MQCAIVAHKKIKPFQMWFQKYLEQKHWVSQQLLTKQPDLHITYAYYKERETKRIPTFWEWILTTSSKAALLPKEQVRCARQLTNEEKSSFGMAVKIFRGNTVIRLLIILEIPTASESSISILYIEIGVSFLPSRKMLKANWFSSYIFNQ